MSNHNFYDPNQGTNPGQNPPAHNFQSNNPWADQSGHPPAEHQQQQQYGGYQPPPGPPPHQQQYQQQQYPHQQHQQQQYSDYQSPPGPAPASSGPKRSPTFQEADFVPEGERGEQREAMQQFELNRAGRESQQERDVEALRREFPGMDSSLVAALYGDAGSMGATREMLMELAAGQQGGGR